ncbi:MAG: DHA2 family efflux MFS transporter permease subunit [Acidobacteriota bacterium]|nr:DHA2 family efflux MFS transporter permease subunit [Acidobacteriota bacterium]
MAETKTPEAPSKGPSAPTSPDQPYAPWKPRYNPWIVALTVTLATFMEVLDTSIANVALPHIAGGLSASQDESTWVLTSYLVSNAVILPISAWLSVLVGRKRFYMACVGLFTISSFLCGLAPTLGMLVLFRVLQGLGGGGLATSEQAILADTFSIEKRGMAFAVYGMAVVLAPAIGPTLGGWITDNYSWRWIFYINVPVGLISLYLTNKIVEDPPYMKTERQKTLRNPIDYMGLGLIAVGIGCLQYVLDKGQEEDWFSSKKIVLLLVASLVTLVWFVVNEWKQDYPIMDLRLLKQRNFATSAFMMFVLGIVLFGTTVLIPQFLQVLMGYTAEQAGKALSAGAVVLIFMIPLVGQLVSRVDPRMLIAIGFTSTSMALYHMTTINMQIDFRTAAMFRVYQTVGLAFLFIPISTLAYMGIPRHKSNQVAGMNNFSRNLGGSIGISMLSTWLQRFSQKHQVYLSAHTSAGDPQFTQRIDGLTRTFTSQGVPANEANARAYTMLSRTMAGQSSLLAYVDIISLMAVLVLCLAPVAFLMKRPPKNAEPVAAH